MEIAQQSSRGSEDRMAWERLEALLLDRVQRALAGGISSMTVEQIVEDELGEDPSSDCC